MGIEGAGLNRFVSEQPPCNILDRRIERELAPMTETFGIALLPFAPLAGGLLSGKYRDATAPPEGTRMADRSNWRNALRISEPIVAAARAVAGLAEARGHAPAAFATAWAMSMPGITSPIVGPRTFEQMEVYLQALDISVNDEHRAAVDAIVAPGEHVSAYY